MAEGQSEYLAHKELSILRGEPFEYPSGGLKLHLSSNVPSSTGNYTEVTGTGYEAFSLLPSSWGNAAERMIANIGEILFPVPLDKWDTPIGSIISDSNSNVWYFGTHEITKIIEAGDPPYFDIGDLIVSKNIQKKYSSISWANKRLNVLRGVAIAPPPFVKLALLSAEPNDTDTVELINIPNFEFPVIPCDALNWSLPVNREIKNLQRIEFPKPEVDIPSVRGFALLDDGDNVMWKAPIAARSVHRKDKLYISPGELVVRA